MGKRDRLRKEMIQSGQIIGYAQLAKMDMEEAFCYVCEQLVGLAGTEFWGLFDGWLCEDCSDLVGDLDNNHFFEAIEGLKSALAE